jgi:uncharacterized membrane protein
MAPKSRSGRARKAPVTRSSPTASGTAQRARTKARPVAATAGTATRTGAVARNGGSGTRAQAGPPVETAEADTTKPAPAWMQWVTFVLAIAGLGVSIYLTYTHFSESKILGCSGNGLVNCEKVTTSAQSYVFGIPVAVLGLAFYAFAVPIMSPWAWRLTRGKVPMLSPEAWQRARRWIPVARLAAIIVGMGFVLYLLYAELYEINSICLYCTSVHVITFLLFVLTVFAAAAWGPRPSEPTPEN